MAVCGLGPYLVLMVLMFCNEDEVATFAGAGMVLLFNGEFDFDDEAADDGEVAPLFDIC